MSNVRAIVLQVFVATCMLPGSVATASPASGSLPIARQRPLAIVPAGVRTAYLYVANAKANSVTAYPVSASGDVRPAITLAGPHTLIVNPVAVAHDPQGRLFVACTLFGGASTTGEVLVFAQGANGDVPPIRTFQVSYYPVNGGPGGGGYNAGPVFPTALAVDWNGYTYVGVDGPFGVAPDAIAVYGPAAQGAAAPLRAFDIGDYAAPVVAVNGSTGEVYAVEPPDRFNPASAAKFSSFAAGNIGLGGPNHGPGDFVTAAIAVAPRSSNVYTLDYPNAGPAIHVFNAGFSTLIGQIHGAATGLQSPTAIAVDGSGQVFVTSAPNTLPHSIAVFAPGANGNVAPNRIIAGPNTALNDPVAVTLID